MNEALNEAVYERFIFIEEKLYWLQFIRCFRGPFIVQMLHIPALNLHKALRLGNDWAPLDASTYDGINVLI